MFAYTVKIILIIDGVAQNGAKVAIAGFERSTDFWGFIKAWENWKGVCLYVTAPNETESGIYLNGSKI